MTRLMSLAACMLLIAILPGRLVAQDKVTPPVGAPPVIMFAVAGADGSDVMLKVAIPMAVHGTKWVEVEKDGKKEKEPLTFVEKYVMQTVDVKVDGKEITAFDVSGKPIDTKDLLKRLAKPARVAVVYSFPGFEAKLDPYYLGVLKSDLVVLKGPAEQFSPAPPKK